MAVIVSIFEKIISGIVKIFKIIAKIVEEVIDFLLSLLGIEDQEIEYYDLKNIRLMDNEKVTNSLANIVIESILQDTDISSNLQYYAMHRSIRNSMHKFLRYIENGKYFEGFPLLKSHITYANTEEVTHAIEIWRGKPCTVISADVTGLTYHNWIRYWLQENKQYDYGENALGSRIDNSTDSVIIPETVYEQTQNTKNIHITIKDTVGIQETHTADAVWHLDVNNCSYNMDTDDYSVSVYNNFGETRILPYKVPSKPTELHFISSFYENVNPDRIYLFVYKAGTGTYPDLDNPVDTIHIDSEQLKALPGVPLRLRNKNFTSFPQSKKKSIIELLDIIEIDAKKILKEVMAGSGCSDDELDHLFVTFGIPMWDTTQPGMGYLFNLFRNIYPAQVVNQGAYNAETGTKSYNNIIIECTDYRYGFQFAYITYNHFTLSEIQANPNSIENGIYYSNLPRFNDKLELVFPYYASSGKGTYNVGYLADTLEEVQDFLDGKGKRNPQGWTAEAEGWLQVTSRMKYGHNHKLLDAEGKIADTTYITPDMCYCNYKGKLQFVESASEATTSGQSITYYYITSTGMDAYTVVAPMAVVRIIDAGSGRSGLVKFNLGNKEDLLVPIVYNFIEELPTHQIAQIVFNSMHCSLYIAYYEYIKIGFWMKLLGVVMIAIIIIATIVSLGTLTAPLSAVMFLGFQMLAYQAVILGGVISFVVGQVVKYAAVQIAKTNPTLAIIFTVLATVAMSAFSPTTGTFALSNLTMLTAANALMSALSTVNMVESIGIQNDFKTLANEQTVFEKLLKDGNNLLKEANELLGKNADGSVLSLLDAKWTSRITPMLADDYYTLKEYATDAQYVQHSPSDSYDLYVSSSVFFA